jgi:hypothetical protein
VFRTAVNGALFVRESAVNVSFWRTYEGAKRW